MSRFGRKNREDIEFKGCGGIADALDDMIKQDWYINDEEYDYICKSATDEELEIFVLPSEPTFSDKRKALNVVDELLSKLYK